MKCPDCEGGNLKYQATVTRGDMFIKLFQCDKCNSEFEHKYYKYTPANCPKHQWEFVRWNYKDNGLTHEIFWEMKCDRCGKLDTSVRMDSHAIGLRESVDLEDPRVNNLLALNKQTARFKAELDKEDVTDFWNN